MKHVHAVIWVVAFLCGTSAAPGGDWPTWRYDAARSAATPDGIAENPSLLWSRKLPPVRQAWPLEPDRRINFDASYEPVVLGKLLFLGSPNDGSVTAYDTDSGAEAWKIYTEGPVRCAPACWKGRLYVGSDDGFLYCLDARTGALIWKFRGAPADRPDRKQIGNGHLVSFWPVRGGPVVIHGTVCFAAGVWPIFGVFLHALDAETGKVRWSNGDLNYLAQVRVDHEDRSDSGLSPQGYLVGIGDRLVVPCGRSMPAGVDLATGRLIYYTQGYRNGDSRVAAHGTVGFVGKQGVISLQDVREVSSPWVGAGTNVPAGYSNRPSTGQGGSSRFDLFESPFLPYKEVDACDAYGAFDNNVAYGFAKGKFHAYDLARAQHVSGAAIAFGTPVKVPKWQPPLLWQFPTTRPGQGDSLVIKAGPRLYGCAGRRLVALESLGKEPRLAWEKDLPGTASSLIAADGKLFVATAEGGLYCFGKAHEPPRLPMAHEDDTVPLESAPDPWSEKTAAIVQASGVKAGYGLVLGLTNGRLIEELLKHTDLTVIGVDVDAQKVQALRRRFDAAGFYGSRVELFVGAPFEFPFPPYIASLMVSEDPAAAGFPKSADAARLFNSLRPYGGTLCLTLSPDKRPAFDAWARDSRLEKAVVTLRDGFSLLTREGALPGSAPWTQEACDAARTFCSKDELVQAPLGFLWYGDQNGFAQFHDYNSGVKPQVVGGRVFAFQQQSRQVTLFAYDAYTGRFLWKNEVACSNRLARFSAQADGVYLTADARCLVFAPDTGARLNTFTLTASGTPVAKDLRVEGDVLVVACADMQEQERASGYHWKQGQQESTLLVGLDRRTGAELWRYRARDRFNNGAFAMGDGMVFGVDSLPMSKADKWLQRTTNLKEVASTVFALEARTGKAIWSTTNTYAYADAGMDDWVAYAAATHMLLTGRMGLAGALNARTGRRIWQDKTFKQMPLIVREETFMDLNGLMYDVATGNRLDRDCRIRRTGCGYATASRKMILTRDNSASYADLEQGKVYHLRNVRSGCSNSLTPADGLLNVPNYSWGCVCNYAIQTSFAMMYMPEVAQWSGTVPLPMAPPSGKSAEAPEQVNPTR